MNKLRWGKFYWSDWADDPALALCSLAAQGLWMRLLCIAAQGTPYGHVTVNGKPPSIEDLAKLIRPRPKVSHLHRLLDELERNGVVLRNASGVLVSRRQESDGKLASVRRSAAKARWNKESRPDLHMQNNNFAYTESDAKESQSPPRRPPVNGGPRGPGNGFMESAKNDMQETIDGDERERRASAAVVAIPRRAVGG